MKWPWTEIRRLRREARGYSDAITDLLVSRAAGGDEPTGHAHLTAAVECAVGMWSRAFATADVTGDVDAITPSFLARVARSLIVAGESVHLIRVRNGSLHLVPVGSWDILGEERWRYKLDVDYPDGGITVTRPGESVIHCRYSDDPSRPWRGVSPLARAGLDGDLLSAVTTRLKQEASATSAYVVPAPDQDTDTTTLRSDLKEAKGGVVLAATMASGYGDSAASPHGDWSQKRIGAHPPDVLRALRSEVGMEVMAACGIPPSLGYSRADGTAARESWRRFLFGSVLPVARIVEEELSTKLDTEIRLGFDGLYASDIVGRAQAFSRMVGGGMEVERAARLSGLLSTEE